MMESITGQMLCRDRQMLFQKNLEELSAGHQSGWAPGAWGLQPGQEGSRNAEDT